MGMAPAMSEGARIPDPLRAVERTIEEYDHGEGQPLGAYAATLMTYGATVAGLTALALARGRRTLRDVQPSEVALMGVATFKLSRIITKDAVTSPLRAAFTTYEGDADTPAEVQESPRETGGLRRTVGELLLCPFCMSQWIGTGFAFGLVLFPRVTRLVASTLTAITAADFLQFAYVAAEKRT